MVWVQRCQHQGRLLRASSLPCLQPAQHASALNPHNLLPPPPRSALQERRSFPQAQRRRRGGCAARRAQCPLLSVRRRCCRRRRRRLPEAWWPGRRRPGRGGRRGGGDRGGRPQSVARSRGRRWGTRCWVHEAVGKAPHSFQTPSPRLCSLCSALLSTAAEFSGFTPCRRRRVERGAVGGRRGTAGAWAPRQPGGGGPLHGPPPAPPPGVCAGLAWCGCRFLLPPLLPCLTAPSLS